ncbi:DUF1329 domain-containing protein [Ideonella sp. B508-1]|uniref:DUF1329 domain-containing protein n=1 Tax=Ideonella sp. B508-1 TaxID=137716 RepID=UPI0003B57982|nr:DUF1329 domain-containing protein [Ideonella sp. B508-1]
MNAFQLCALAAASAIVPMSATAGVSKAEAAKLGTAEVTWFGADARANADGSIPAWTGGILGAQGTKDPAAYVADKPLYSITAANMAQHASKLTEGQKEILKRFPDYRIDVYPTRRTFSANQWIMDNTRKNAQQCTTIDDGNGLDIKNCLGGVMFPLPQTGKEVMWNFLARVRPPNAWYARSRNWVVEKGHSPVMTGETETIAYSAFFDPQRTKETTLLAQIRVMSTGPARAAGEGILMYQHVTPEANPTQVWQYIPGQRRVRLAPELAFDTPSPNNGGLITVDQTDVFLGSPERYQMKIVGKQEKLLLNNNHKLLFNKEACGSPKLLQPSFVNPECMRWELQRVYVVEATVQEGKRHLLPKRVFYIGEDGYQSISSDDYDSGGKLYRTSFRPTFVPAEGGAVPYSMTLMYDFARSAYVVEGLPNDFDGVQFVPPPNPRDLSPDALAATGVR